MGLDMYAFKEKEGEQQTEIHYWRKHPNLHGWMESLYLERGGEGEFNCVKLQLFSEDLDRLERDILSGNLPETLGFFFGKSYGNEAEDDLQFIAEAREAIADGWDVFYDSWW